MNEIRYKSIARTTSLEKEMCTTKLDYYPKKNGMPCVVCQTTANRSTANRGSTKGALR